MARTIRNAKLDSPSARARLKARREPYWTVLAKGRAVGFRSTGKRGTWIARYRDDDGLQHYRSLGEADGALNADGTTVLSFTEAQTKARQFFQEKDRELAGDYRPSNRRYTVANAIEDYLVDYRRRGGKSEDRVENVAKLHILPALGKEPIAKLGKRKIESWLEGIASSRPRVRSREGDEQRYRQGRMDADKKRARKATANRTLTVLKAALNYALDERRVADGAAWQSVKPYREVDAARLRYLSDAEAKRLVNACDPQFRLLVTAALLTGCRYGELTNLTVRDFDASAGTIRIGTSKTGRPRHVALTDEGREFFTRQVLGRPAGAKILTRDGERGWSRSDQQRPLAIACSRANIEPITFHGLRHTYASRLAMKGVPLAVIAAQLGHSDTRMVEKHYGHLAPNYIADTVRAAFTSLGIVDGDNVIRISAG